MNSREQQGALCGHKLSRPQDMVLVWARTTDAVAAAARNTEVRTIPKGML